MIFLLLRSSASDEGGARLLLAVRVKSGAKDAETYVDCSCADPRISDTGD